MGCVTMCFLFVVNLLVFSVGLTVIGLASYVIHTTMDYSQLFMQGILMLPLWTLIGGVCLTLLGFFGCCGTLRKSSCMLRAYGSLVLVFVTMELVCGILLLVMREQAGVFLEDRMMRTFKQYGGEDQALTDSIDVTQHELECCGVHNYSDWLYILSKPQVTPGCCREDSGVDADTCYLGINMINFEDIEKRIYIKGCYESMLDDLADETLALGILSLTLVVVQLLCIIFAFTMAHQIVNKKRYSTPVKYDPVPNFHRE